MLDIVLRYVILLPFRHILTMNNGMNETYTDLPINDMLS